MVGGGRRVGAMAVSGCGGGSTNGKTPTTTTTHTTPPTGTGTSAAPSAPSAEAQIRRNWVAFFDGSTPVARRIALLEYRQRFAAVIRVQSKTPIVNRTSAGVGTVSLTSPSRATVVYSVDVGGQPVLKHRHGTAVRVNGTWKVADSSFCALLDVQGTTPLVCSGS